MIKFVLQTASTLKFKIQLANYEHFINVFVLISRDGLLECARYRNFAIISYPEFIMCSCVQCERSRIYEVLNNRGNFNENPGHANNCRNFNLRALV